MYQLFQMEFRIKKPDKWDTNHDALIRAKNEPEAIALVKETWSDASDIRCTYICDRFNDNVFGTGVCH